MRERGREEACGRHRAKERGRGRRVGGYEGTDYGEETVLRDRGERGERGERERETERNKEARHKEREWNRKHSKKSTTHTLWFNSHLLFLP